MNPGYPIILGAGMAGLAAALHLAERGHPPLVLEAAPTAGGRTRSFVDPAFALPLDCGPHLLVGSCHRTLALLDTLGSRPLLHDPGRLEYHWWQEERGFYRLQAPRLPPPLDLLVALGRFPPLTLRDLPAILRFGQALARRSPPGPDLTVREWLAGLRQTPALNAYLWEPLALAILNLPADRGAATPLATVLQRSLWDTPGGARPLIPTVPLSRLLVTPAIDRLQELGGQLRTRCRVLALVMAGDRVDQIVTTQGTWESAGHPVISTLPQAALARLLPDWVRTCGEDDPVPIVSVYLRYPRPVALPFPLVGIPGSFSQWIFDLDHHRVASGEACFAAVLSAAFAASRLTNQELVARVHQDVVRLLPGLVSVPPRAVRVVKEHRATPAITPNRPRPPAVTPWSNLVLAGDWTATGLPATIEGAIQSGQKAAQIIAGAWGGSSPPVG